MTAKSPKDKLTEVLKSIEPFINDTDLDGFYDADIADNSRKQIVSIIVYEIIEAIDWHEFETPNEQLEYWQEVKKELELL